MFNPTSLSFINSKLRCNLVSQLEIYNAIWLLIVIFMLHDFEEIIAVENWAKRTENRVNEIDTRIGYMIWRFWNVSSYNFAKRDVFIFLTMSIITFIKIQYIENACIGLIYLCFLLFVLIHNVLHIIQTLVLRTYTPGFYTAVFLVTPYVIYLIYQLTF